jgi:hypothetical protein
VQLVEVDVIRLQALQRAVDGGANVGAVEAGGPLRIQFRLRARAGDLGGDQILSRCWRLSQRPTMLSDAPQVSRGRHGVHLGGVEEIDAAGQREIELGVGIGFAGLLAEGHGAEADLGNHSCCGRAGGS